MATRATLQYTAQANASTPAPGTARVTFGPERAFQTWVVRRITIQSTSGVLVPTFYLYRTVESQSALLDGSSTGNFDINILEQPIVLTPGERLVGVWGQSNFWSTNPALQSGGCDAGADCRITVEGDIV